MTKGNTFTMEGTRTHVWDGAKEENIKHGYLHRNRQHTSIHSTHTNEHGNKSENKEG